MMVLNELDRFHLVEDVIDRLPELVGRAAYFNQAMRDKLIEHKNHVRKYGEDMLEVRDWKWAKDPTVGRPRDTAADNV
jgi:xylulose-5-phosphate/fructose-6-phosphate phosphoketolase